MSRRAATSRLRIATAKDGDDVIVNGIDIRLQGIAEPEDSGRKREPGGPA